MKKKTLGLVLILLIVATVSLSAASMGSIGLVNYGSLAMFEDPETSSEDFLTGLRGEFYFGEYLGVSADALILWGDPDADVYYMIYFVNVMGRLPLGFIEPYAGIGAKYQGLIVGEETVTAEEPFGFNFRGGVDINILDWLSVGIEANYHIDDLEVFFDDIPAYFEANSLENSLIGVTAKFKF
jgi:hypothetical protein